MSDIKHEYIKVTFYDEERKNEHSMTMAIATLNGPLRDSQSIMLGINHFFQKALLFYANEFKKQKGEH